MFRCAVCKEVSKLVCVLCKKVFYCGKDHQVQHWADHMKSCVLNDLRRDDEPVSHKSTEPEPQRVQSQGQQESIISRKLMEVYEESHAEARRVAEQEQKLYDKEKQQKQNAKRHKISLIIRRNLKIEAMAKYVDRSIVDLYVNLEKLIMSCKEVYQFQPTEENRLQLIIAYLFYTKVLYPKRPESCLNSLRSAIKIMPPPMEPLETLFPEVRREEIVENGAPYFIQEKNNYYGKAIQHMSIYYMAIYIAKRCEFFPEMEAVIETLWNHVASVYGTNSCELSNLAYSLGMIMHEIGKFERARAYIMDSMQRRESLSSSGLSSELVYDCIFSLALCEKEAGNFDNSLLYFKEAERLVRKLFGEESLVLAGLIEEASKLDVEMGDFRKAFNYAQMAYLIYKKHDSKDSNAENCLAMCAFIYKTLQSQAESLEKQLQIKVDPKMSADLNNLNELLQLIQQETSNNKDFRNLVNQKKDPAKKKKQFVAQTSIDSININQQFLAMLSSQKARLLAQFIQKIKLFTSKISLKKVISSSKFYKHLDEKERRVFQEMNPEHFGS